MANTNIVLSPVDKWAQGHLEALLQATSQETFNASFDSFVSKDVEIVLNGANISRDEYKQKIRNQAFDEVSAIVNFTGVVGISSDGSTNLFSGGVGEVGLFYTTKYFEGIVIRDAPIEIDAQSSINLVVINDPSIPRPSQPAGIRGGFFDNRRVSKLNQILVDTRAQ